MSDGRIPVAASAVGNPTTTDGRTPLYLASSDGSTSVAEPEGLQGAALVAFPADQKAKLQLCISLFLACSVSSPVALAAARAEIAEIDRLEALALRLRPSQP